jgi:hypothetical protein
VEEAGKDRDGEEKEKEKKKEKEPSSYNVTNPSRLIPAQRRFIAPKADSRYQPVDQRMVPAGIVMLIDRDPTAPQEVQKVERVPLGGEEEAEAPADFEWDPAAE